MRKYSEISDIANFQNAIVAKTFSKNLFSEKRNSTGISNDKHTGEKAIRKEGHRIDQEVLCTLFLVPKMVGLRYQC